MISIIESASRTPEDWQYWGGFFGEALKPTIDKQTHKPGPKVQLRSVRTYFEPRLHVFDRRELKLNHVQQNFGGKVNEQSPRQNLPNPDGFTRGNGFRWRLGGTDNTLQFLQAIQPYIISQDELVTIMIDFLSAKKARMEHHEGQYPAEISEAREREEAEFHRRFIEARNNHSQDVRLPFTPANMAGVIDASGAISLSRGARATGKIDYASSVEIHSDNKPLLKVFSEQYNGLVYPARSLNPTDLSVFSDKKYYCLIRRSDEVADLLETTLPYLGFLQRQAEIALGFLGIQQTLTGDEGGWKERKGELNNILDKYSSPSIDLVTMLREGFYSEMYRLNHE